MLSGLAFGCRPVSASVDRLDQFCLLTVVYSIKLSFDTALTFGHQTIAFSSLTLVPSIEGKSVEIVATSNYLAPHI